MFFWQPTQIRKIACSFSSFLGNQSPSPTSVTKPHVSHQAPHLLHCLNSRTLLSINVWDLRTCDFSLTCFGILESELLRHNFLYFGVYFLLFSTLPTVIFVFICLVVYCLQWVLCSFVFWFNLKFSNPLALYSICHCHGNNSWRSHIACPVFTI